MKLSKTQQEILDKMEEGVYYGAYSLQCRINTLEALAKKGYIIPNRSNGGLGAMFCPRTHYQWKKK